MYRLYGMVLGMLLILGVAGFSAMDRTTNYKPAKATVSTIDRTCNFVESTRDPESSLGTKSAPHPPQGCSRAEGTCFRNIVKDSMRS